MIEAESETTSESDNVDPTRIEQELLSQEYSERITEFINERAVAPNDECPVCGHFFNIVAPTPYTLTVQEAEGAVSSGREMPMLATVCHNCGFVRLFSRRIVDRYLNGEGFNLPTTPLPPSEKAT